MRKLVLISMLLLMGCNRQMTDSGYHYCYDGVHEYDLKVLLGKNKGARDNGVSKIANAYLYVFPNSKFSIEYKLNGFNQGTPNVEYELKGDLMTGSNVEEQVVTDPITKRDWVRKRILNITVNNKTGQLIKMLTENHLDMNGNITSTESYNFKAQCDRVSSK